MSSLRVRNVLAVVVLLSLMLVNPAGATQAAAPSSAAPSGLTSEVTTQAPTAAVQAAPRVAYIFSTDTASRDAFNGFLTSHGYAVDLVPLGNADTFDFSGDQVIIIGTDTGSLDTWGTPAAVAHVNGAGKPILGVGEGGYAFFGRLNLAIGWGNGAHSPETQMVAVDPSQAIYSTPNPITMPADHTLTLYAAGAAPVDTVSIDVTGTPPAGVTLIGQRVGDNQHYPLISQTTSGHCYLLWGWSGNPRQMTATGQSLFLNALVSSPCACSLQIVKLVSSNIASPGDILTYKIVYDLVGGCQFTDVTVRDALPVPDVTYLPGSANPPATYAGGVLTWHLGNQPGGTHGVLTFQVLVNRAVCERQRVVINQAMILTKSPELQDTSNRAVTEINCRPVDFPTNDPPYAESEITVDPYPLVTGQLTKICTTIHNSSNQPQTVRVEFDLAIFGIGQPFQPIPAPGNPRIVVIPPGGSVTVCIFWTPTVPGHQCVQIVINDVNQKFQPMRSQRNLDVNEVLQPGKGSTFTIPVRNDSDASALIRMVVRNTCGWNVVVDPAQFTLGGFQQQVVNVTVTPPAGAPLGTECTLDIEAWTVDRKTDMLVRLIGGIRKIDRPQIPLGPPGEPPYAEQELRINPYPLISGVPTQACAKLVNNTDNPQTVTVDFRLSTLGIGLVSNRIPAVGGTNPRTVVIPPHSTIEVCITFIPSTPGHHCMYVALTQPNGYSTYSAMNLDIAERLVPGHPTDTIIPVANPTGAVADIDLVVDNTCPGWTASVSPATLTGVGPNSGDVRNVTLTVTPPPGGMLGSNCHIDLQAYINGVLIGGVRKIDRPPVAPPVDEPHYAEGEITVHPDPPVVGQPTQLCATLTNPTDADQQVNVTFSAADFGAGIPFTPVQTVANVVIPAHGSTTLCITWTPQPGGTLHKCIQIKVHQDGYHDVYSQRNIDLRRPIIFPFPPPQVFELPPFLVHNPLPDPAPFVFDVQTLGLFGVMVDLVNQSTGQVVQPGQEVDFKVGETQSFFVRVRSAMSQQSVQDNQMVGDRAYIDVVPYVNGQPLTVDGAESGVRFEFDQPLSQFLPLAANGMR